MAVATMAYALSVALVGLMSWRVLGPWWGAGACMAIAALSVAGAFVMWRLPNHWVDSTVVVALVATVALGASIPATVRGILAVGEGTMTAPTMMVTLVLVGIASTIYLAFAGTSLLEDRHVRAEEYGDRPLGIPEPGGYAIAGQ